VCLLVLTEKSGRKHYKRIYNNINAKILETKQIEILEEKLNTATRKRYKELGHVRTYIHYVESRVGLVGQIMNFARNRPKTFVFLASVSGILWAAFVISFARKILQFRAQRLAAIGK
jgi:hypothetical protein